MDIKVCGNTNINNLEAVLELMPEQVGFVFYPGSKRFAGHDPDFRDYVAQINTTYKVGVFVNETIQKVEQTAKAFRLDFVQLHGHEPPEYCRQLSGFIPVIKAFGVDLAFAFSRTEAYQDHCCSFLFDTATTGYGGSGRSFDWAQLSNYKGLSYILSGGLKPEHAGALKSLPLPGMKGIDVNSCFEIAAGVKNIPVLKKFIHAIRS